MSKKYSRTLAPLDLDINPSRWLRRVHALVVLTAWAAVVCTPFSWPWQVLLAIAVLIAGYRARPVDRVRRLQFDRGWHGVDACGRELQLQLDRAVVWPMLIVLQVRDPHVPHRHFAIVVLPDSVEREGWRRLRLFLNHIDVFGDNSDDDGDDDGDDAVPVADQRGR